MNDGFNNQGGFGNQNNAYPNGLNNQQPMMDPNMMQQGGMDPSMMNQGMMNQPEMDPSMMQQQGMDPNMMNQGMMQQGMDPGMMQQQPMMDPGMMQQQPMMDPSMMQQGGMDPNMMNQGMINQQGGMDPSMMQQQPMMDPGMMNQQGMDPSMMNQQGGMDPSMMQQPMMNQGMQPGMMNNFNRQSIPLKYRIANLFNFRDKRNMIILVPIVMVVIVLFIIIFSLLTTRSLKCTNTKTNDLGVVMETTIKVKYKFGHINTRYEERIIDYTKSDVDNDTIESEKEQYREMMADTCKKSDGCTYTFKAKKKKVVINMKNLYDKKARLDLEDYYPTYSDFKDAFNDACESEK